MAKNDLASNALNSHQTAWLNALPKALLVRFYLTLAAPLVNGILFIVQAWLLAHIVSEVATQGRLMAALWPSVVGLSVLLVVRVLISGGAEHMAWRDASVIKQALRAALFERMVHSGPYWTASRSSGALGTALVDYVDAFEGYLLRYWPALITASVLPLGFGLVLLPVDAIAAALILVTAPLIPVFMILVGWGAQAASQRHQRSLARLSGLFADRVRGMFTLRLLRCAQIEAQHVHQANRALSHRTMAVLRIAFLSSAVLELFAALGVAGVAVYVGLSYLGHLGSGQATMSLHTGLFCLLIAPEAYMPLRQLAASYHDRAQARAAVVQLESIFGELPPVTSLGKETLPMERCGPSNRHEQTSPPQAVASTVLVLTRLVVRPARHAPAVLTASHLSLCAGEHVALQGPSGVGKTTLLETIAGWRGARQGELHFAGRVVAPDRTLSIRDGLVLISQRPYVAAASIRDNLHLANPAASDHELWAALRAVRLDGLVQGLPHGLDSRLGVGGYGWSGGQQHRLGLARLFLTQPILILLDEPTAHLDGDTRDAVMDEVLHFARNRSLVVASHDPAVSRRLERTWHIVDGTVAPC